MFTLETDLIARIRKPVVLCAAVVCASGAPSLAWAQFTGISQTGQAWASLSSSGSAGANYSDSRSLSNLSEGTQSIYAFTSGSSASLGTTVGQQLISMGGSATGSSYTQYATTSGGTSYPIAQITGSGSSGANVKFAVLASTPVTFSLIGLGKGTNSFYLDTLNDKGSAMGTVRDESLLQLTTLLPGTYRVGGSGGLNGWGLTLTASAVPEPQAMWAWLTGSLLMTAAIRARKPN